MKIISSKSSLSLWLLLLLVGYGEASSIIRTLPGYSGLLPFNLETGYVSADASELFYLFVESQGKPWEDPLLLYLIGGPGCSSLNGFFFQVGPLVFNTTNYDGGLPQLIDSPHSWTKTSSIIFLDAPVGTGYSYSTSSNGYNVSDTISSAQIVIFMKKWLLDHPKFSKVQFFIATDSYSGVLAPVISTYILESNAAGEQPYINLKGFLAGSPHTDTQLEANSKIPLAYRLALISKSLYDSAWKNCNGSFDEIVPTNAKCAEDLEEIEVLLEMINDENILDPKCASLHPNKTEKALRRSLEADSGLSKFNPSLKDEEYWCRNFDYLLLKVWAKAESVQDALHVRKGTVENFLRCNISERDVYTRDVLNGVDYYKNLTTSGLQILLYTGDHDLVVPFTATEIWIGTLNLTVDTAWRPWFVKGQIAGYTVKFTYHGFRLTFATLKGSGHSPTQYKPLQCLNMFERWIHYYPL